MNSTIRLVSMLAIILCLNACSTPLVLEAGKREFARVPAGAKIVACRSEDGVELKGLYIPGPEGAPIVLHLLPRGASATTGVGDFAGFHETLATLARCGYSSLVIDYRGVGASAGETHAGALARDARAMWALALERAGGDSGRVVLRAASLGTIAAAAILESGARPGAVVMAAPIDSDTIKGNAAGDRLGSFLGAITSVFMTSPAIRPLGSTLEAIRAPVLVLLPDSDALLPEDEVQPLIARASSSVGFRRTKRDHHQLVLRFYGFELDEQGGRVIETLTAEEASFLEGLPPAAAKPPERQ